MNWSWTEICGQEMSKNITTLGNHDFKHCFQLLAFITAATHTLPTVVSMYHLALHAKFQRTVDSKTWSSRGIFRLFVTVGLSMSSVSQIKQSYTTLKDDLYLGGDIAPRIATLNWLFHIGYAWQLRQFYCRKRLQGGPSPILISWMVLLAAVGIQLQSKIRENLVIDKVMYSRDDFISYAQAGLHLLYLLSLVQSPRKLAQGESTEPDTASAGDGVGHQPGHTITETGESQGSKEDALGDGCDGANVFSRFSFRWVLPILRRGAAGELCSGNDTYQLPKDVQTREVQRVFRDALRNLHTKKDTVTEAKSLNDSTRGQYSKSSNAKPVTKDKTTLFSALWRAFGLEYLSIVPLKLIEDFSRFSGPIMLNYLIVSIETKDETSSNSGYFYASCLFVSSLLTAAFCDQFWQRHHSKRLKVRAAMISSIYEKTVSVSMVSMGRFTTGEIVNFMNTDAEGVANFLPGFTHLWNLPFEVVVCMILLYQQIGVASLVNLGIGMAVMPMQWWLLKKNRALHKKSMELKDNRVKIMNEVLNGIRVIKFYALEDTFVDKVNRVRSAEMENLRERKYIGAFEHFLWVAMPAVVAFGSFTLYALMGNTLTAAKVFPSLALNFMIAGPCCHIPHVLNMVTEARVSLKRLQDFMDLDEQELSSYYTSGPESRDDSPAVKINKATLSWRRHDETDSNLKDKDELLSAEHRTQKLEDVEISVERGQLVGIVGKVGSGKSSLLAGILAEMSLEKGSVEVANVDDGFGYTSQEAWIQQGTVRENILSGMRYEATRYQAVIEGCALAEDLQTLPAGDKTEIGENGVNLSGGQKARVGLARAVYQDKDIYLLDDPFAAVDIHVAQHIFSRCIMGILRHSTRILCTHQTHLLDRADLILVLDEGRIVEAGPPNKILGTPSFRRLHSYDRSSSIDETKKDSGEDACEKNESRGTLVDDEDQKLGAVQFHVYQSYMNALGLGMVAVIFLTIILVQVSEQLSDWWISHWVSCTVQQKASHNNMGLKENLVHNETSANSSESAGGNLFFYVVVYGCLTLGNSFFTLLRMILVAIAGQRAAEKIHSKLLGSILQAPVSFFDTTPIGRILNRFSSDVETIDNGLSELLNHATKNLTELIGALAIICYGMPWFLAIFLPFGLIYIKIQTYYGKTSRALKRITKTTSSPIFAHFSESITGLMTIRAMRQKKRFEDENADRLDLNQRAQYTSRAAAHWFSINLQFVGITMTTGVAFIAIFQNNMHDIDPALVGLVISYSMAITNYLNGIVHCCTEAEKNMVSMERAKQYMEDVPSERMHGTVKTEASWLRHGVIEFVEVALQYRPGLPNALNGVSFKFETAEKIGIVGRTGSGKSTLFLALYRLIELVGGCIKIDGVDISKMGLQELRSRLAIIPQDPFLFSGSVRENLDPAEIYQDEALWEALEKCHMKLPVERLGGLDADVAEKGKHFSVGQRQLLCLARALLAEAKILCMDEATASVDQETDQLIQRTIKAAFSDKTVLTIAHRINTVLESNRVLVMESGRVAEFAAPEILLQNPESIFSGLVRNSGL